MQQTGTLLHGCKGLTDDTTQKPLNMVPGESGGLGLCLHGSENPMPLYKDLKKNQGSDQYVVRAQCNGQGVWAIWPLLPLLEVQLGIWLGAKVPLYLSQTTSTVGRVNLV